MALCGYIWANCLENRVVSLAKKAIFLLSRWRVEKEDGAYKGREWRIFR